MTAMLRKERRLVHVSSELEFVNFILGPLLWRMDQTEPKNIAGERVLAGRD
jgi:hypothetical protein